MIRLAVFDMAGTTVRDGDAVSGAFRGALESAGVHPKPEAVIAVMGLAKPEAIRILLVNAGEPADEERVRAVHTEFVGRMREYYRSSTEVGAMPEAEQVFARLRAAGVKVALNTGFSRPIVDVLLARLGWSVPETLDAVIASDEVERGRPHPDMIRELMRRLEIADPAEVAKIGDTEADLREGSNTGCGWVIGVGTGNYTLEELAAFPHTHLAPSVAQVPELLLPIA